MDNEAKTSFLDMVRDGARSNFARDGQVDAFLFFSNADKVTLNAMPIKMSDEAEKDKVAAIIERLRDNYAMVAMVTEAWMKQLDKGEEWDGTPASKCKGRIEIVGIHFYSGMEQEMHMAEIIRSKKGATLGPWKKLGAESSPQVSGRFGTNPATWN